MAGTRGFDIPDVHVGEVRQTFLLRDGRGERDPVGRNRFGVGACWQRGVAVARVPVHGHGNGRCHAVQREVVDANVGGGAAAGMSGLEEDAVGDAGLRGEIPGLNVAEAAGGLTANGDGCRAAANDGVVDLDVVGGAIDAESVGVAAGLEAEGVVVILDVGVGDVDVVGGVDVDAVGGWTANHLAGCASGIGVRTDGEAINNDVMRVEDLHGPEAGTLEQQAAAVMDIVRVLDQREANALRVVVGGPAEAFRLVFAPEVPVLLPPDLAVAVDGAFAGDSDVVLVTDVDEGGRPSHLDASDAGGEFGEVSE